MISISGTMICITLLATFLLGVALTGLVRVYSMHRSLLDIPNHRSSHSEPTPSGGGVSLALIILAGVILAYFIGILDTNNTMAMFGGGLLVSIIGWLDDHQHIAARWRAITHLLAAYWALFWLGGVTIYGFSEGIGMLWTLLAGIAIGWLINLYNFMDGTDGIASIQAIAASCMGTVLLLMDEQSGLGFVMLLVAGACAGFLVWNWAPAKIFMGDVGSYLIGFIFGVIALSAHNQDSVTLSIWIVLMAVFIFDASYTLIKRFISGEKWYAAHRSHAYQRLVLLGYSHRQVALLVLAINILFLYPMAWLIYVYPNLEFWNLLFVASVMLIVWWSVQRRYNNSLNSEN